MIQNQKHPTLGVFLALGSSLLFGLNASTTKILIGSGISAANLVLFRCLAVVIIAGLILVIRNPGQFKLTPREVPFFTVFGVVGVGLMQWAYSNAVSNLQVGIALLIEYTAIVMVPVACFLLIKEKIRARIWIAIFLVLLGLAVVSKPWVASLNLTGVIYAILAAIFLSTYFIMGERVQRKRDAVSTMFYAFLTASIFWSIPAMFTQSGEIQFSKIVNLSGSLSNLNLPTWTLLAWVAIFGSFAPMLLTFLAMRHLSASGVGIASTAETVFAFIFGFIWLGENIDLAQLLGGLVVITGIVVAQTARSKTWQP